MDFNPKDNDTHSKYNNTDITYTISKAGYYETAMKVCLWLPTGKYETILNPNRLFFQFWKPRYITREIYEMTEDYSGR